METKPSYRIVRHDENNWCIEKLCPAGEEITQGPAAGTLRKEDVWKITGYFSQFKFAAARLLDEELGEGWTGADAIAAIEAATERVLAAVEKASVRLNLPEKSSTTVEHGLSPEQISEVKESADPVKTYLRITGGKRFKRTSAETAARLDPREALMQRLG
jgi:hypothetical protein